MPQTEREWLGQREYPEFMLDDELPGAISERKRRLLSVAFCCRAWHLLTQKQSRRVVEVAERYADGEATTGELRAACTAAEQADHLDEGTIIWGGEVAGAALIAADHDPSPEDVANIVAKSIGWSVALAADSDVGGANHIAERVERAVLCELVRDVLGNPFSPAVFSPQWGTETVIALARQMYVSRDFSGMPVLADALQDVGCESHDILDHCRGPGPHVRGCWLVDLVLGKT